MSQHESRFIVAGAPSGISPPRNPGVATSKTPANQRKIGELNQAMEEILGKVLTPGFFGTACVKASVHDGTIQTICERLKRVHKQ